MLHFASRPGFNAKRDNTKRNNTKREPKRTAATS